MVPNTKSWFFPKRQVRSRSISRKQACCEKEGTGRPPTLKRAPFPEGGGEGNAGVRGGKKGGRLNDALKKARKKELPLLFTENRFRQLSPRKGKRESAQVLGKGEKKKGAVSRPRATRTRRWFLGN